jgi:cell filamentation protein
MKQRGNRYSTDTGVEGAFQPGSRGRVLLNLRGITRKRDMDRLEYETLARAEEAFFMRTEPSTRFTAEVICRMHQDWLGGIYEWAGKYRTVELSKAGFRWPPAYLVAKNMADFEAAVLSRHTPCRPRELSAVCVALAEVHAELLLIHPFRDGNGRLARWLAEAMTLQAGLPLPHYGFTGRGSEERRRRYLAAVQFGYGRDYRPLADFFAAAIERGGAT